MLIVFTFAIQFVFTNAVTITCTAGESTGPCDSGPCLGGESICVTLLDGSLGCCPGDKVTATCPTTSFTRVTVSTCVDLLNPVSGVSDCPKRASLCTDSNYLTVMRVQCPRTCGFCGSTGTNTSTSCVDQINLSTGTSDCPSRISLCTSSVYSTLMRSQCPRTCGFC